MTYYAQAKAKDIKRMIADNDFAALDRVVVLDEDNAPAGSLTDCVDYGGGDEWFITSGGEALHIEYVRERSGYFLML